MLFWRGLFGGLLIVAYVAWRDGAGTVAAFHRIRRPGLLAAGCSTAATICFINALRETSVADVLVINATAPFITAAMVWAWTGVLERRTTMLTSGMAFAGVVAMVVPTLGTGQWLGNLLAFAMTVLISGMMVVMRHYRHVDMLPAASLSAFLCGVVVWPRASPLTVTGADLGWLVLFGTTQFGLGQLLLTIGLRAVSATRSALIGSLEVPLAPAFVWIVLGEVPAVMTGVGGAIVLAAVCWDLFAAQYGVHSRHGASSATD